jgi:hypothetical protein
MTANNDSFSLAAEHPANLAPVMGVGSSALLGAVIRGRAEWLALLHKCQNGEASCLYVLKEFEAESDRESTSLRAALARCLPIVQADAQMMADISRFAPLDHASQAAHDMIEYESERLAREIPVLLGLPNV